MRFFLSGSNRSKRSDVPAPSMRSGEALRPAGPSRKDLRLTSPDKDRERAESATRADSALSRSLSGEVRRRSFLDGPAGRRASPDLIDGAGTSLRLLRFEPERKNLMNPMKIQSTHLARRAYVYVRQSTPLQVLQHQESTERQYRLQQRALDLGWPSPAIEIIDEDQGRSGTTAVYRTGFQRLISDVSLGKVGLVLMLEASRLARNNSDWHRLIEICSVSRTLIAD